MSRSAKFPLLRSLLEAAKEAQLSDQQIEQRVSRRSFLKSSAIVAGISTMDLLLPPISYSQRKGQPRIAIIGAGLAGLTAAYELRRKGIAAKIYEANNRVGGRVMTARDVFGSGLYTEYGGEFIDSGHTTMSRLAREFKLRLLDVKPDSLRDREELMYFGGKHRTRAELVAGLRPAMDRISTDAAKIKGSYTEEFSVLDHLSLEQYLASLETDKWIKDLLTAAFVIEYGLDAGQQSSCNMLSMIDPVPRDSTIALYGASDERYCIEGGNDLLAKRIAEKLGNQIETGENLMTISSNGSGFGMVFSSGSGTREVAGDIVICTVPFTVLRTRELRVKLSGQKRFVIEDLTYGSNSKIIHGVRKNASVTPWERMRSNGTLYTDLPIQAGWDSAPRQSDFDGSYTIFQGGSKASIGRDSVESSLNDLEVCLPGFNQSYSGTSKSFVWKDYEYSRGSYSAYGPGQWSMQGIEGKPEGDLYFAGEHCSIGYQGFMEGAAETGVKAAKQILSKVHR